MNEPRSASRISVIVLTHNRRDEVLLTIARLLALPEAPPVIVVDNASTDGTAAAVAACFPGVDLVRNPSNLGAAGRNLGALRARTPYIAFSDDDTDWRPGSLPRAAMLLDAFPSVGLVCARVRIGAGAGLPEMDDPTSLLMARSPLRADGLPGRPLLGFMAGACAMRRDLFIAMGGYRREFFVGGEEALLALDLAAARWLMLYCDDLVVAHRPSPLRDADARRWLLARNRVWVAWMRLPLIDALRETVAGCAELARDGRLREGLAGIWRGLGFAFDERRVLPRSVMRDWRRVEAVRREVEAEARIAAQALRARLAADAADPGAAAASGTPPAEAERLFRDTIERMRGAARQPDDLHP